MIDAREDVSTAAPKTASRRHPKISTTRSMKPAKADAEK